MFAKCQTRPESVSLRSLFPAARFLPGADILTAAVTSRVEEIQPGTTFAAIRGLKFDGAEHAPEAARRGAVGILTDRPLPGLEIPQCVVPHVRLAFGQLCAALAGDAVSQLPVIGVTGTNGKTTTAWICRHVLQSARKRCGLLGTIEYDDGQQTAPASLTTPDTQTLWQWLRRMAEHDCQAAAMELSSHALDQHRAAGLQLSAAIVTNVTHDHLDYHGTFDDYWASKQKIFQLLRPDGAAIVNLDDAGSARMKSSLAANIPCRTFSLTGSADVMARDLRLMPGRTQLELVTSQGVRRLVLPMTGRHNVSNALAAAAALQQLGLSLDEIANGFSTAPGVPGRLQTIDAGQPFTVLIDYAHTDDALSHVLQTVREVTAGRVICVFGAGGDRDRLKRPKLGRVAASLADFSIVTSDNPRSEVPAAIASQIVAGMGLRSKTPVVLLDRHEAIDAAIRLAQPGDCVLIAGKGHETVQIIGDVAHPFDDAAVARRCLLDRHSTSPQPALRIPA